MRPPLSLLLIVFGLSMPWAALSQSQDFSHADFSSFLAPSKTISPKQLASIKQQSITDIAQAQQSKTPIDIQQSHPEKNAFDAQPFQDAMGEINIMQHMDQNITSPHHIRINPSQVRLFGGHVARCHHLMHVPLSKSCCSMHIKRYGLHINGCHPSDYQLAADRRAGRAHLIGRYCAQHLRAGIKTCVKETYVFCRYPSVLAKSIQEKGRAQLNQMVAHHTHNAQHNARYATWQTAHEKDQGGWEKMPIGAQQIALWHDPLTHVHHRPISVSIDRDQALLPGGIAMIPGLSISADCSHGLCQGQLVAQGLQKTIHFKQHCQSNQHWQLGQSRVRRLCVSHPAGMLHFHLHGVTHWVIDGAHFYWQLAPHLVLQGQRQGPCDHARCAYQLDLEDHGQHVHQRHSFSTLCHHSLHAAKQLGALTLTPDCPKTDLIIASCNQGDLCRELPPKDAIDQTLNHRYHGWSIQRLPPMHTRWHTLPNGVALRGGCQGNHCHFQLRVLGQVAPLDTVEQETTWTFPSTQAITLPTMIIKPQPIPSTLTPQAITVQIQPKYHPSQTIHLPLQIPRNHPLTISNHPSLKVWGSCNTTAQLCRYHWLTHIPVHAMSWGDAHHPHCQGFKPATFALLNWQAMHLAGDTHPINPQGLDHTQQLSITSDAQATAKNFPHMIQQHIKRPISQPNTQAHRPLRLYPLQGQGPFMETAVLASTWESTPNDPAKPPQQHIVKAMRIYWGDGTMRYLTREDLHTVNHQQVFVVKHLYDRAPEHNQIFHIMAIFYTDADTYIATGDVSNVWNTPDEGQRHNLGSSAEDLGWVVPS